MKKPNITPTPWETRQINPVNLTIASNRGRICSMFADNRKLESDSTATAIVTAVNNTYGKNINPEAIEDVVKTLEKLTNWAIKFGIDPEIYAEVDKALNNVYFKD